VKARRSGVLETPLLLFILWRMTSIWELANPQLRDIAVTRRGSQLRNSAPTRHRPTEIVKLASNENPIGPSPKPLTQCTRHWTTRIYT
jgi:hypothetical protein